MFEKFSVLWHLDGDPELHVQAAGSSYCDGSYRIERRNSMFYVFEAVESGRGTLEVEGAVFHPAAGDCYLIPAGTDHCYYSDEKEPWIKHWFNASGSAMDGLLQSYGLQNVIFFPDADLIDLFRRGLSKLEPLNGDVQDGEGAAVLIRIIRELAVFHRKLHSDQPLFSEEGETLRDYLEQHLREHPPTLAELARLIHRSEAQTLRIFRRDFGTSPIAYLLDRKIETAENLLTYSPVSVKELAQILGFDDRFYFSRLFKRKTGLSPLHFQQRRKNEKSSQPSHRKRKS